MEIPDYDMTHPEIAQARLALNDCNWTIGRTCAEWLTRHGSRYKVPDFAASIHLSPEQVQQRLEVWVAFEAERGNYPHLLWSHFYAATKFSSVHEAHVCLKWAEEMQATVGEMKAWRRAQAGEDLSAPEQPCPDGRLF